MVLFKEPVYFFFFLFAPITFYSLFFNFCFYQFFFLLFPGLNNLSLASLFFCCFLMNGIKVVNFPTPPHPHHTVALFLWLQFVVSHSPFQMVCHFSFDFLFTPIIIKKSGFLPVS